MQERRRIQFDNKIPLTWLLSTAGTVLFLLLSVLWNVAGQSNKLDQLVSRFEKLERHNVDRDTKLEVISRDAYDARREAEVLKVRVDNMEKK